MDAHNANVNAIRVIGNNVECDTSGHAACSTSTIGVGFWIGDNSKVLGNVIQYHGPLIRIANSSGVNGDRDHYHRKSFRDKYWRPYSTYITYGDPGGVAQQVSCLEYSANSLVDSAGTNTPKIGPETPASGNYSFSNCSLMNNSWGIVPSSGTFFVNSNGGSKNLWGRNQASGTILNVATVSPAIFDLNSSMNFLPETWPQGIVGTANDVLAFGASGSAPIDTSILYTNLALKNAANNFIVGPQNITVAPAANTITDGWQLYDTTAASAGNQQYSPAWHFQGQGWKTTATAASQAVDWRAYLRPLQGASAPDGWLVFQQSINGGAYGSDISFVSPFGTGGIGFGLRIGSEKHPSPANETGGRIADFRGDVMGIAMP